jgi:hypothetical protein
MLSSIIFTKKGKLTMLIKRIRTMNLPSSSVSWDWADGNNTVIAQMAQLEESLLNSGVILFVTSNISDDGLTNTKEVHFTSIENFINYEKQVLDLSYNNGDLYNSVQYLMNNGITHTLHYIFEP